MTVAAIVKVTAFWGFANEDKLITSEKIVLKNPATIIPMKNPTKSHQLLSSFVPYCFNDSLFADSTLLVNHPCISSPSAYVMTMASVRMTVCRLPIRNIWMTKTTRTPMAKSERRFFFVFRLTKWVPGGPQLGIF